MTSNRELLASISFEPMECKHNYYESNIELEEENDSTVKGKRKNKKNAKGKNNSSTIEQVNDEEHTSTPMLDPDMTSDSHTRHTQRIICCLKTALQKSIISISEPAKERPLDPTKDFMIESTMVFSSPRGGISCCGGSSAQVRHPRMTRVKPSTDPVNLIFGEDSDDNLNSNIDNYHDHTISYHEYRRPAYSDYFHHPNNNININKNNSMSSGSNMNKCNDDMRDRRTLSNLNRSFAAIGNDADGGVGATLPTSTTSRSRYRTQSFIMREEEEETQREMQQYHHRSHMRSSPYVARHERRPAKYRSNHSNYKLSSTLHPPDASNNNINSNNNNNRYMYNHYENGTSSNSDCEEDIYGHGSSSISSINDDEDNEECDVDELEGVDDFMSFTFTDFAPMCYRHIREFLHVNPKTYLDALMKSRWRSIPTPGKSNAQLFFCGRDWVIKSMKSSESEFLRDILHRYYYHVRDNPFTLLPHFTGHYRLQLGRMSFDFIIMKNVFATINTIDEKFDLKGSTIGRYATEKEKMRATCTQKDLDIHYPIHLTSTHRRMLMDQIKRDCDFLCRSKIIDYSLLVGIHIVRPNRRRRKNKSRLATPCDNVLQSIVRNSPQQKSMSFAEPESSHHHQLPEQQQQQPEEYPYHNVYSTARAMASGESVNRSLNINGSPVDATMINRWDECCFTSCEGGMPCSEIAGLRKEIYYIGIIDILQEYNTFKHLETMVRTIQYDGERISCVPPRKYAARFVAFMSSIII